MKTLLYWIHHRPYTMNFWALMAIPAFNRIPYGTYPWYQLQIFLFIQLLFGTNVLWYGCYGSKKRFTKLLTIFGFIGFAFTCFQLNPTVAAICSIAYYIGLVCVTFRRAIRYADKTIEALMATISGFILIALTGFFAFQIIESVHPGSFYNQVTGRSATIDDLFYYAFVTIMTIGYGDVVAVTWPARNTMILMAMTGYLYSLVFIARMVSNYQISWRSHEKENSSSSEDCTK